MGAAVVLVGIVVLGTVGAIGCKLLHVTEYKVNKFFHIDTN